MYIFTETCFVMFSPGISFLRVFFEIRLGVLLPVLLYLGMYTHMPCYLLFPHLFPEFIAISKKAVLFSCNSHIDKICFFLYTWV